MAERIFVAVPDFPNGGEAAMACLQAAGLEIVLNASSQMLKAEEVLAYGRDFVGTIAANEPYRAFLLDQQPRLRCISRMGVGLDSIDLELCKGRSIAVCTTPDPVAQPVAELAIGQIIALLRRLGPQDREMRTGVWNLRQAGLLQGRTVGIIGLGRIGRRVAELLQVFGVTLLGSDYRPDHAWAAKVGLRYCSMDELLPASDILCLHFSWPIHSPPLIGAAELAKLKRGGLVINNARGHVMDYAALDAALASGQVCGAALDVFPQEPYQGTLGRFDQVLLSPHCGTCTRESWGQMKLDAARNLVALLQKV
jgi:D-3-phosphoglycerate dehydrogenase / 2-oxoglutarate reductase